MTVQGLLSDESKWIKGEYCRYSITNGTHYEPVAFCLSGAISMCYGPTIRGTQPVILKLTKIIGSRIETWNDLPTTTFADVRRVIEEANI